MKVCIAMARTESGKFNLLYAGPDMAAANAAATATPKDKAIVETASFMRPIANKRRKWGAEAVRLAPEPVDQVENDKDVKAKAKAEKAAAKTAKAEANQ